MLSTSREKRGSADRVQADFDRLPFAANSFDAVFSNFSIQWSEEGCVLQEVYSALQPGGYFALSTVLTGSLQEIKNAWLQVDNDRHTHSFVDEDLLRQRLTCCGFDIIALDVVDICEHFASVEELLASVKGIGAGNHLLNRPRSTMPKGRYKQFVKRLAENQTDQGYPLSYRIARVVVKK